MTTLDHELGQDIVARLPVWLWASWQPKWKVVWGHNPCFRKEVSQGRWCFSQFWVLHSGSLDFTFGVHWGCRDDHHFDVIAVFHFTSVFLATSVLNRENYMREQLHVDKEHMSSVSLCWSGLLKSQDFEFLEWERAHMAFTWFLLNISKLGFESRWVASFRRIYSLTKLRR